MDREKQIEEMAAVINEMDGHNAHYYDKYMRECEAFADADAIAKVLYDAGYRKQSEVVMEIFDDILKIKGLELHDWEAIFELKKKYTGEKEDGQVH